MRRYHNDPKWITARFASRCDQCGAEIKKGDRLYWFPRGKRGYCETHGQEHAARFEAEAFDEAMVSGNWG